MKKIAILGAGEIGSAIEYVLSGYEGALEVWDKDTSKMPEKKELQSVLKDADIVFLCVPSWSTREALEEALPHVGSKTSFVILAKGLDNESQSTMDVVLKSIATSHNFGILGGPLLAEEILAGKNGVGVLASQDRSLFIALKKAFKGSCVSLEYTDDVVGVALSGVVKNLYAVALGVSEGLGLGDNERGWAVSQALREMIRLVTLFGGTKKTVLGTAGLGDLIATGFSSYSSNHAFGKEIAIKGESDIVCEGVYSLVTLAHKINIDKLTDVPLFLMMFSIINNGKDARTAWKTLTHRCFNTKLCY